MAKYKCPECGGLDLRVFVTVSAKLIQYTSCGFDCVETKVDGDQEWDETSNMDCSCGFTSASAVFEVP